MSTHPSPPNAPVVWQPGLTVGRYSLLSRIAIGGMAELWLARQEGLRGFEKFVVIKRILDAMAADPELVKMFLDEARIAAQLNHPHIVQIYDLGQEAGAYYIAMEYLPGENLATLARAGARQGHPMPLALAVRIIANAAEGLAYAHARTGLDGAPLGIVHRDVSPHNLHITYDGVVKVVDFGIAKAAHRESQTVVGQVKGKTAYMSPEQARGEPLDARSDLFALGVILFELVTRSRLFQFSDPLAALAAVTSPEPLPLAHKRNPEVPEALGHIIARAIAREPAQRYASARDFQLALEAWLREQKEVPGAGELAAYMGRLFRERIQERARLLESARTGEISSRSARRVISTETDRSLPASPPAEEEATLPRTRKRGLVLAGIAVVLLLAVGVGVGLALGPEPVSPAPPPVVAPAPAPQPPAPVVLTVETEPAGAQVLVDGKEVGRSPLTLELPEPGAHRVMATLEGRQPASRQVTLAHPGERAMVVLSLPPEPVAPLASEPPAAAAPAAPVKRPGRLRLDTVPWTRVYLRGRLLGDTPLIDVALPAGRHQLKLVNEERNISTLIEVEIRSGQSTVKRLKL